MLAAIFAVTAISMAFGWLHTQWFPYSPEAASNVLLFYLAAASTMTVLFLAGHLIGVRSHAFFMTVSGLVFLAVDVAVWWNFGIMPGPKSYQDGVIPAAIMGLFMGQIYKITARVP
jgi:hypothetical protein